MDRRRFLKALAGAAGGAIVAGKVKGKEKQFDLTGCYDLTAAGPPADFPGDLTDVPKQEIKNEKQTEFSCDWAKMLKGLPENPPGSNAYAWWWYDGVPYASRISTSAGTNSYTW